MERESIDDRTHEGTYSEACKFGMMSSSVYGVGTARRPDSALVDPRADGIWPLHSTNQFYPLLQPFQCI